MHGRRSAVTLRLCRGRCAALLVGGLAAILALPSPDSSAEEAARARLGSLVLRYNPAEWSVAEGPDGIAASCRGPRCGRPLVTARVSGEGESGCSESSLAEGLPRPGSRAGPLRRLAARDGLDILVLSASLGCRNARPDWIEACTTQGGRTYRFSAPVRGCRGGPGFGSGEALTTLLSGLSLR